MKKALLFSVFFLSLGAFAKASDSDDPPAGTRKSLKDEIFTVETDETSASESLERVSGKIDLGFAAPDQTYQSSSHSRPGPFGRQELSDSGQDGQSY